MVGTLDEEFSAEELAYMNSKGADVAPSLYQPEAQASTPAPSQNSASDVPAETEKAATAQDQGHSDEAGDEGDALPDGVQIRYGKDGKARLVDSAGKFVKSVSHRALHAEREKRKAAQSELQQAREQSARVSERLAILNEAFSANGQPQQAKPQAPVDPLTEPDIDPEADIFGAFKQLQRRNEAMLRRQSETVQAQTARETFQAVTQNYHADAQRFMQAEPSFKDAYAYLVNNRMEEMRMLGETDEAAIKQRVAQEETMIVMQAMQAKKSPAEVIFGYAKARGFKPQAPVAANGNAQPAPIANASSANEKIAQLRNGQNAAQSLSSGSGSAQSVLTYERLANMSDAEFETAVAGMSRSQIRQLMGA